MTLEKTSATAAGKWNYIIGRIAPELQDAIETTHHVPCPVHGGKDGFRMYKDGSGGGVCNSCGSFSDGFKLLKWLLGWDFPKAAREVDAVVGTAEHDKPLKEEPDPAVRLKKIQAKAEPAGEFIAQYLKGRGLSKMPPTLLQARLAYWEQDDEGKPVKIGTYITMIGKIVSSLGKPITYHLTYLEAGNKASVRAPKKILPPAGIYAGSAIRLWPQAEHIGVSEGIETAIAARELFNIPTWSVMHTAGMLSFIAPDGIKKVTVFSDNDANYAGQAAAYTLANRLKLKGLEVDVKIPPKLGDWLDILVVQKADA